MVVGTPGVVAVLTHQVVATVETVFQAEPLAEAFDPELGVTWIESPSFWEFAVLVGEGHKQVFRIERRLQHDSVSPEAAPVESAGHALTAGECGVVARDVGLFAEHATSDSRCGDQQHRVDGRTSADDRERRPDEQRHDDESNDDRA